MPPYVPGVYQAKFPHRPGKEASILLDSRISVASALGRTLLVGHRYGQSLITEGSSYKQEGNVWMHVGGV